MASRYQGELLLRASRLAERSTSSVRTSPSTSSSRLRPSRPPAPSPYLYERCRWEGVLRSEYFMGGTRRVRLLQAHTSRCRTALRSPVGALSHAAPASQSHQFLQAMSELPVRRV